MSRYDELEGPEWRCFNGHVEYEGLTMTKRTADRERTREPSHGGSRL